MPVQIQFRRDSAADWTSADPTLASGELGYETDTGKIKVGDGANAWTALAYYETAAAVAWGAITGTLADQTDLNSALSGKAASSHTHTASNITDFSEAVDDRVSSLIVAGTGIGVAYNDGANTLTISNTGSAPAWGDITGTLSAQTDLQSALDAKATSSHTHAISDVTGLQTALDGKQVAGSYAAATHTHAISDVTGLQTALDGKVDENSAITGATKTKITYDAKGLVTAGADATTSDIGEGSNLYYTDARARGAVSAGTGVSYDSGTGVITNSAPDQTVVLTAGTGISTSGTYPTFTINSTITQYTDELAQDAVGAMVNATLTYVDGTPSLGINLSNANTWATTQTFADTIHSNTTADRIASFNGTKTLTSLDTTTYPSLTELAYVKGVTSGVQSQIDGKAASSHTHTASQITDFSEAVDDRVNALLVEGSNITITYDDGANTLTIAAAGSGGVADGDKGDITVSSSGTVWTVDADAITYSKIQNVSATDRLLGRSTAGAGDIEEIVCTAAGRALLDDADAAAQRTTLGLATGAQVAIHVGTTAPGSPATGDLWVDTN